MEERITLKFIYDALEEYISKTKKDGISVWNEYTNLLRKRVGIVCFFFHQTINSRDNSFLFHNYTSIYATKIELYVNKCSYSRIKSGFPWNYRELSIPLQSLSDKNRKQKQGGTEIIPIPILFTPQSYGIFLVSPSFFN